MTPTSPVLCMRGLARVYVPMAGRHADSAEQTDGAEQTGGYR
jgi:hypothetical protein